MRKIIVIILVGILSVLGITSAQAEGNGGKITHSRHIGHKDAFTCDTTTCTSPSTNGSRIFWTRNGTDSIQDSNGRHLQANVEAAPVGENDGAEFYTNKSLNINKLVGDVNNLSWDEATATTGAGAPRFSVVFTNNHPTAFLASSTCSTPLAAQPSWSRADFTGATSGCSFGAGSETFSADGVHSAWDALVAAHPDWRVSYNFMVFDEVGNYSVDRISLGTDRLYNYSNWRAVVCHGDEDRC